jgi:glycosyltransferase involved in cell wall biosynthesis
MKKILAIITRLDRGGSSEDLLLNSISLCREGHQVRIVYGRTVQPSSLCDAAAAAGVTLTCVPALVRSPHPLKDAIAWACILRLLFRERPDVVHTRTSKAGILGRSAAWLYRKLSGRNAAIIHSTHGHVFYGYYSAPASRLFVFLERLCARITDTIIVLTENELREHLSLGIGKKERFAVIHSGIEYRAAPDPARSREELNIPEGAVVIGSVGRLEPVKGYRYLIDALRLVRETLPSEQVRLLLAGDGTQSRELKEQARRHGLEETVTFLGWRQDVKRCMACMDIFVQPSLNEGMGKTILQAQMLGVPVVATRVQGIVSLIEERKNGLLTESRDARALAEAIIELVRDPALRNKLGQAAHDSVWSTVPRSGFRRFSIEEMNRLVSEVYTRV